MNYAQRYNTDQLDAAFKNAASMFELFSGQTDDYYGINNLDIINNVGGWKGAYIAPNYSAYLIAKGGFKKSLTKDQIKQALGLVAYMDHIKVAFAGTNINTESADGLSWDNPYARYYAEQAPTFTGYEPLAFYTIFTLGYSGYNTPDSLDWSFYDPNVGASVAQPGPWGTQAMVFENRADNNTFLFYNHFSYNKDYGQILKAKNNLKLKEGRKITWHLTSVTSILGLQTTEFRDSWTGFATAEEQNEFVINSIFSELNYLSGFDWYLTQKPSYSTSSLGLSNIYGDNATIIAYRDFNEDNFINDGGSFVFVEIENPQSLEGDEVNCLCRDLKGKRVPIDNLWITQYPKGDETVTEVKHYPSTFDGIASFENKYPDHIAYPKAINRASSEATKEYGHSFPESPSLDLVTDVNGQGMPQQISVGSHGESATYYPDGYTEAASTTKQDYDDSKQLKTQIGTGDLFTRQASISLIYPENSIGKTTENGTWYNTYDDFRYFSQSVESGISHGFKEATGLNDKFTYPVNHSSKFGESFSVDDEREFFNLEPLNFNKQILPWNDKSNYSGQRLKNQYITGASAASSHNYSEHYRSNESQNNYPSAVDTIYHISTLNFKTGTFKVKQLDTEVFTSEDVFEFDGRISTTNTPRQYFSLPKGGDFLVIQPSSPHVYHNGYISPTFAHQISVEFDPNHYYRVPRHIRYFEEGGLRYFMIGAKEGDRAKKKINWQVQREASRYGNIYGPFADAGNYGPYLDDFSNPILYAGHKHSAYPLDYEEVTLNLGTSDFEMPTLNVFGAAQFNSEIVNYTSYKKQSNNYLETGEYNAFYQETNSDWELDPYQVTAKPIAIDPVLRWGIQDGRFEEGESLEYKNSKGVSLEYNNSASFGSQKVKEVANLGDPYFQFKAEHKQRILNLNNLPRVYGTPHSVKHYNVGKINSHPDICYIDEYRFFYQDGRVIDLRQAEGNVYNEASNINYRLEFDGFVKAYGEPREDKTDILPFYNAARAPLTYVNPADNNFVEGHGGSYNREYDETYYKYGDDGNLSIEISVRRRYKNQRPVIPDLLIRDLVAQNYSVVNYDSILSSYAGSSQNPFGEIDSALKISSSNYYTRMPYETYDIDRYSPVPKKIKGDQYNWHIENGLLDIDQENARRRLAFL